MQIKANNLSSQIIHAHMGNYPLSLEELTQNRSLDIGFYRINKEPIITTINNKLNFQQEIYEDNKKLIYIDKSAFGHLDVHYTVIREHGFFQKIEEIKKNIIMVLLLLYVIVALLGYYLAKLFIKPIQMKRIQLNNFMKDSTHELNTPISALLMSIQTPSKITPKQYERIKISAKRISDIYQDLTYLFLRNDQSDMHTAKKIVINQIIKEQVNYLKPLAQKKRLIIIEHYDDDITFTIDEESLIRLINNLFSNAIKYNNLNGTIEIIMKKQMLIIKDSGIGVAKEYQKEIYKRFYRGTNESGGFGLGLNIVYKICQNYGIDIKMRSEEGIGTEFTLNFSEV